jgi:hypothetical protein
MITTTSTTVMRNALRRVMFSWLLPKKSTNEHGSTIDFHYASGDKVYVL